jgi:preprotein translocase subunit SecG
MATIFLSVLIYLCVCVCVFVLVGASASQRVAKECQRAKVGALTQRELDSHLARVSGK